MNALANIDGRARPVAAAAGSWPAAQPVPHAGATGPYR